MAIDGGVMIQTLRGSLTVASAAESGTEHYCFSWRDGQITVGKVFVWPEPRVEQTYKVFLDDGSTFLATWDQMIVRRDGGFCTLSPPLEVSCLPLYTRFQANHWWYRQIGNRRYDALPRADRFRWRRVARMVYEWKSGEPLGWRVYIKHLDRDPQNCTPENLWAGKAGKYEPQKKIMKLRAVEILKMKDKILPKKKSRKRRSRKPPDNHKILAVRRVGKNEVYDLDTALPGCFNVGANGIFLVTKDENP